MSRVKAEDYIDEGQLDEDSEEDGQGAPISEFETLINESFKTFKQGEITSGTIVRKSGDLVIVDIGFKSEGTIQISEFGRLAPDLKVGDKVDVLLEKNEDAECRVVLSKEKADKIRVWEDIAKK